MMEMQQQHIADAQQPKDLVDSFLIDARDALVSLGSLRQQLARSFDQQHFDALEIISHRLHGSAALYKFEQISRLAELIERIAAVGSRLTSEQQNILLIFLEQAEQVIEQSLESIEQTGSEGRLGLELARLGGSQMFFDLIRDNPGRFVKAEASLTSTVTRQTRSNIRDTLQTFYRENGDVWEYFAPEVSEHLEAIADILDDVAEQGAEEEQLQALFRSTHTLKGAAFAVGFEALGDLSHQLEELMVAVRDGRMPFDQRAASVLRDGAHVLASMMAVAEGESGDVETPLREVLQDLSTLLGEDVNYLEKLERDRHAKTAVLADTEPLIKELQQFYKQDQEMWEFFQPEVQEQLEVIRSSLYLLANEASQDTAEDSLSQMFRAAHTIKGACYMVGLTTMGDVAKALEDMSSALSEGHLALGDDLAETFFLGAECLEAMLDVARGGHTDLAEPLTRMQQTASTFLEEELVFAPLSTSEAAEVVVETPAAVKSVTKRQSATIRVSLDKLDALMSMVGELVVSRARLDQQLRGLGELVEVMSESQSRMLKATTEFEERYLNPRLTADLNESTGPAREGLSGSLSEIFDELEFDSYSDMNILARSVSEMSDDVSEMGLQLRQLDQSFREELEDLQGLTRELRSEVSRARMVPIGQLFGRLRRLLRQESDDKAFELRLSGEAVEVDNAILESISDALLHLVKNSVAHGIESMEQRRALGKNPQGRVSLSAGLEGNTVLIDVADDGRGINLEAVKAKAIERGFITHTEAQDMSADEAMRLIFLPGLSTAETITTDAGRGVGMDAVSTTIEGLKGHLQITSRMNEGTRFSIRLPLTLLVSEALIIHVADQRFAFAIDVIKSLQIVPEEQVIKREGREYIVFEGQMVRLNRLARLLEMPEHYDAGGMAVVFVQQGSEQWAFAAKGFAEIEEVVIKNLGMLLEKLEHIAGASIAAAGDVLLLLDPRGLARLADVRRMGITPRTLSQAQPEIQGLKILLVDDSVSVRRVLAKMLMRSGNKVTTANDGQEAIELLRQERFDVVLTDLEMPRVNGYELLEDIRRREATQHLPVMVITSRASEKHMKLAYDLGATNYAGKPIDERRLNQFLESVQQRT